MLRKAPRAHGREAAAREQRQRRQHRHDVGYELGLRQAEEREHKHCPDCQHRAAAPAAAAAPPPPPPAPPPPGPRRRGGGGRPPQGRTPPPNPEKKTRGVLWRS